MIEEPNIRAVEADDAARMAEIYNYYVENTIITFESEPVTPAEFLRRIGAHPEHLPWYVIEDSGVVMGYCYAAPWKQRSAYANSVETSIYLDKGACGKGLGKRAYSFLIANLEHVHAIMGGGLPCQTTPALPCMKPWAFRRLPISRKSGASLNVGLTLGTGSCCRVIR